MTNKVHDISSAPKDAPRNDEPAEANIEPEAPSKIKNFLHNNKKFFIGVGTGLGVGVAALAVAKVASEEEDEELETPEV